MKKKNTYLSFLCLTILAFLLLVILKSPIQAKSNDGNAKIEVKKTNTELVTNNKEGKLKWGQTRVLDPVENEKGLKATPIVFSLDKNGKFPDLTSFYDRNLLVKDVHSPPEDRSLDYEYVTADGTPTKPSSENVGFQIIYLKITGKVTNSSIIVPIPVWVKEKNIKIGTKFAIQYIPNDKEIYKDLVLYPKDILGKSETELKALIASRVKAYDLETGQEAKVTTLTHIIDSNTVGRFSATIEIVGKQGSEEIKETNSIDILVFGATPKVPVLIQKNAWNPSVSDLLDKFSSTTWASDKGVKTVLYNEDGQEIQKIDNTTVGFQWLYVKLTDNYEQDIFTTLKVPVNIIDYDIDKISNGQVLVQSNKNAILYAHETKNKAEQEINQLLDKKVNINAWNSMTGKKVTAIFTSNTVDNKSVGKYNGTYEVTVDGAKYSGTSSFIVFGAALKAPYYIKINYNSTVNMVVASQYFSKFQSSSSNTEYSLKYEWVADKTGKPTEPTNTLDTSKTGFKIGYIKVTDRDKSEVSTVIPIPITITDGKDINFLNDSFGIDLKKAFFLEKDFKDLDSEQIVSFLNKNIHIKAWDLIDGEENIETEIISSSIVSNQKGNGTAEIRVTGPNKVEKINMTIVVFPDNIFENEDVGEWTEIPKDSSTGVLENPINHSKMSFPNRGLSSKYGSDETGFLVQDSNGTGYVYSKELVADIPGVDGKALYNSWARTSGISASDIQRRFAQKYFLRKENRLKQIDYDETNEIVYVYDLSIARNLNFFVSLKMYNMSNKIKKFSMLESVDTDFYSDSVPIYALENATGFYMEPVKEKRFSIKLKDSKGRWLSDYTKFIAGNYMAVGPGTGANYFSDDFSRQGSESIDYKNGDIIANNTDTGYQLAAPWKEIEPGKALKAGYEVFAGQELPYMNIKSEPEEFNVYRDHQEDFQTKYTLSKILTDDTWGTIYVTYPNEKEIQIPFTSNKQKEFEGDLTIPRDTLPEKPNEEAGTIKHYSTSFIAVSDKDSPSQGLPSEEYDLKVNVYNIGAQPIPQIVKKGSSLTQKPEELLRDQVILPGHKASYEFEGEPADTSTEGVKFVSVKMTDVDDPKQSAVIKVPIVVVDGEVPTSGIIIGANSFKSTAKEFEDLSKEEINKLIIKKSNAIAFDVQTGSTENITLDVDSTDLVANPSFGDYKATFKAKKDFYTYTKDIGVKIQPPEQNVIVDFKDEVDVSLHEPIILKRDTGTTIDLTKETEVQKALATIKEKHYALVTSPKDETAVPVEVDEKTVTYEFKGTVSIQSAPKFLNFGRKTLGTMFIKVDKSTYDAPLFIFDNRKSSAPWTLTATLQKPLTSQEDPSKDLPRALRYKLNEDETVVLKKGMTQPITKKLGEYTVSDEWNSNQSGLQLEVPSGEVLQPGGYRATILWQVQTTP